MRSVIHGYRSVQAYFAEAVERAAQRQQVEASADVLAYLVRLLERFGAAGAHSASIGEPLALLAQRASQSSHGEAAARHRDLGDVALFVGGFFSELLERRGIAERYVHDVGRAAYLRAAALTELGRDTARRELLTQLGRRFQEWVSVVDGVRASTAVGDTDAVARLLERWLSSRRPGHLARLLRRGVSPLRGPGDLQ